ncbi:MAG: 30S ribosomal protein S10 [Candidatus Thermoplasmatota archaeon]|nr:30S ribosomal protein S10 [Candidatus Thermoplasmatota archaeon]MCL6003011.1 30S ribosomal protein S10 [Candidatus Thermoplasmatota archaeon]
MPSYRMKISLSGTDVAKVDNVCTEIRQLAGRTGVEMKGPIPLLTKRLVVPIRKAPNGAGTATWDRWEMRVHRRLIYIDADERTIRQVMRIQLPDGINIEVKLQS